MDKKILIPIIVIFVLGIGIFAWQYFVRPAPQEVEKEIEAVRKTARDIRREADMGMVAIAQKLYFEEHDLYFTSVDWPPVIPGYLPKMPTDPLEHTKIPYVWVDNTGDNQRFCAYATLEKGGWFTASHRGTFECADAKPILNDCCFPEEEPFVFLSGDAGSILMEKDGERFLVYSISQWHKWAEENGYVFVPEPPIVAGVEVRLENFYSFTSVSLSPDQNKIIFASLKTEWGEGWGRIRPRAHLSAIGILDLNTKEVSMINIIEGKVEEIIWSPDGKHFAYILTTITDRGKSERLAVNNVVEKKHIFSLYEERIAQVLGVKNRDSIFFVSYFQNVEWFSERKLYFLTYNKISRPDGYNWKGHVRWVINVDGRGLEKIKEITIEERLDLFDLRRSYPREIYKSIPEERGRIIETKDIKKAIVYFTGYSCYFAAKSSEIKVVFANPTKVTVIDTAMGMFNDSQRGSQERIDMVRVEEGWKVEWMGRRWKCWRRRGPVDWTNKVHCI